MKTLSKEDYLKLLEELSNESDQEIDDISVIDNLDITWMPSESAAKAKMLKNLQFNGTADATHMKKAQIKEAIAKSKNLQVGHFSIKIRGFYVSEKQSNSFMHLDIYERRTKTATGQPCNMDYKLDVMGDKRFIGRPWLNLFNNNRQGTATNVPIDTVVEIVKWLQALKKLAVFL